LAMTDLTRQQYAEYSWAIENYHRGLKQCTEIERCQARSARAQRNHVGLAVRAFLRLEGHCFSPGVSLLATPPRSCVFGNRLILAIPFASRRSGSNPSLIATHSLKLIISPAELEQTSQQWNRR